LDEFQTKHHKDSTTKIKYISTSMVVKEDVWIKIFITKLGVAPSIVDSVIMYLGFAQENEPKSHQWSKHVFKWFYLIREIIEIKYIKIDIMIKWVPTKENLTDPLTKALF